MLTPGEALAAGLAAGGIAGTAAGVVLMAVVLHRRYMPRVIGRLRSEGWTIVPPEQE